MPATLQGQAAWRGRNQPYAGFADATDTIQPGTTLAVVQLLTPVSISLTKHQQLKAYLKTARHEVKHDLHQIK